jgi:hypothetical protein
MIQSFNSNSIRIYFGAVKQRSFTLEIKEETHKMLLGSFSKFQ